MNNSVSIKDIAKKFKCAPSTISRALNDHPAINIETRKTIQEYALKVGYQKNTLSLSLLNNCSMTLGLILPSITHYHESSILEGMEEILLKSGYLLNICVSNESHTIEKEYIDRLLANRVDGLFISMAQESYDQQLGEHIDLVIQRSLPVIFIDRPNHGVASDRVVTDDYQGAFMATQHLIDMGCQRIAHLHGPSGISVSQQRFLGFQDCLLANGRQVEGDLIQYVHFSAESAIQATRNLMQSAHKPDAIFGVNDEVCIAAMFVLREMGVSVPHDVAIVGFDDIPLASFVHPPLSSVSRQSRRIGEEAAKLFLSKKDQKLDPMTISLDPKLIIRESSLRT
ncbi:LacI family transcriptional regulator [Cytophagaceae bacterium 50C-KIRBA]|uniref:LacI family transcriptional regulator n=1 Tax=Aquirufa beregesia TaxID=2516556 RepID=A0ABX0F3J7_9BACT|nr:LacI family DNA-binding transcriptional regulator [Aquirufa beregesia]NGZ44430.1 LacI family transcriptional regulator [Aquirufa beregesia]